MEVYLLYNEKTLGYPHHVAIVSDPETRDKFLTLNRHNRVKAFELDPVDTIHLINKGSSSDSWTEYWRKAE